ncbi:hypothetical protein [Sinorhizobium saheli]|uniref:Uncharacterized protein n=1 Tax=Sinorhizobium saheli TaxID=36856 RepID=A0A178YKU9_SINSA|nr:hypothetical protein [Sinorhizobium saheli]MQW86444.1 hypothetical protein [Sinorhizobium saheli]OAP48208.1 hypothetical protein ATB98_20465 [Sinorhizobium saheli]
MPLLTTIIRFIRIVVLCFAIVNLHGFAAAANFQADHQCPSVAASDHEGSQKAVHPGSRCPKLHCCPILQVPPSETMHEVSRTSPPFLAIEQPFLLVRALYPPPKPQFS